MYRLGIRKQKNIDCANKKYTFIFWTNSNPQLIHIYILFDTENALKYFISNKSRTEVSLACSHRLAFYSAQYWSSRLIKLHFSARSQHNTSIKQLNQCFVSEETANNILINLRTNFPKG